MIKVGFVTKSLTDGNAIRGVGFYAKRLLPMLKTQCSKYNIEIVELDKNNWDLRFGICDLIHYPFFDLFQHTLRIFRDTKTIVTIHDVIPLEFPDHYPPGFKGKLNLFLQKLALSSVERVITDSYASVQAIRKYLLVPHNKIKLVYLAADAKFRPKEVTKKHNLPKKFVLYVGDVNWNKNIPNLIKACEQISYPLVIIGKQATEIEKMDLNHPQLQHLKNLDFKNVTRLGFVSDDDLVDIYNLASVYCQPSLAEGFGLPVLEAMACGTQMAVSNIPSLSEIAGDMAEYFDPKNVSDMSKALQKSVDNKFDVVSQANKFTWEKTATKTLLVYSDILQS